MLAFSGSSSARRLDAHVEADGQDPAIVVGRASHSSAMALHRARAIPDLPNLPPAQPSQAQRKHTTKIPSPSASPPALPQRRTKPVVALSLRRAASSLPPIIAAKVPCPSRPPGPTPRTAQRTATGTTNHLLPLRCLRVLGPSHDTQERLRALHDAVGRGSRPPFSCSLPAHTLSQGSLVVVPRRVVRRSGRQPKEPAWTHRALATRRRPGPRSKRGARTCIGGVVGVGASGSIISNFVRSFYY
jgi:hypothetical protein